MVFDTEKQCMYCSNSKDINSFTKEWMNEIA